jgi:SPX domain protein involved in polyphosphate accumulation
MVDNLQLQRFELKYRITSASALGIREFVACHLALDEFSVGKADFSYENYSIYLDSDDYQLYWDVINGNMNRYKLRLRYYDDRPESPVFFEIKRRSDNAILKKRAAVRRDAVALLLAGHLPEPHHLLSTKPEYLSAIQHFCRLMHDIGAQPRTRVGYLREAWVSREDNSVRVTMDRQVRSKEQSHGELSTDFAGAVAPFEPDVILEIKFTSRYPDWLRELVQAFGAVQCGAAKYADGVALMHGQEATGLSPIQEDLVEKFLRGRRVFRSAGSPAATADFTYNE